MDSRILYSVLLGALSILVFFLSRPWWRMRSMTKAMAKQGIPCPPYTFMDGHFTELQNMAKEAISQDMSTISHDFSSRLFPFLSKYSKIYGGPFLTWWKTVPILDVTEPSLVVEVLSSKFGFYQKFPHMEFLFGKGVVMASGESWVRKRRIINVSFQQEKIKGLLQVVASCTDNVLQKWEERIGGESFAEIEVQKELTKTNEDVILKCLFGSQFENGKIYFQLLEELMSDFPSFAPKKVSRISREIDNCIMEIVEKCKENMARGCHGNEILASILKVGGEEFSTRDAVEECKTLLIAGHDTISQHLTWTMMLLGLHQDWQEKAYQEVKTVFQGNGASNQEMLHKLKIITMIIYESLRLYPPATYTTRYAVKDMQLGDEKPIFIPKGLSIGINVVKIHHDPSNWGPDVNVFNPERFSEGVSKACKNPFGGYLPFLMGPRVCVGQSLAFHEAKIFLSSLLLRFKWHLSPNYKHAPQLGLTLQPQHGVPVIITQRTPLH